MGRLESNSVIYHFSHEHSLKLLNLQPQTSNPITCSGCKRNNISGAVYACNLCNYFLHKTCSNLPQTHTHQVDQEHSLVLLSTPAYPEGKFDCNACGCQGTGFSYHCPICELDLHPVCAFMPLEINHGSHNHALNLCFVPPYENNTFSCDICEGAGSNHWLYRCNSCEFDAHMKCAKSYHTKTQTQATPRSTTTPPVNRPQVVLYKSRSAPQPSQSQTFTPPPPSAIPHMQPQYSFPGHGFSAGYDQQVPDPFAYGPHPAMGIPHYVQPKPQPQPQPQIQPPRGNGLVGNVVEGIVEGMAQQAGQAIFAAILNS